MTCISLNVLILLCSKQRDVLFVLYEKGLCKEAFSPFVLSFELGLILLGEGEIDIVDNNSKLAISWIIHWIYTHFDCISST